MFGTVLMWESMVAQRPRPSRTRRGCSSTTSTRRRVPNGVGVSFANEEGSFLVGAAAALESKTGTVGYIGANASPLIEEFRAGFEQGAKARPARHRGRLHAHRPGRRGRLRRATSDAGVAASAGRLDVHGRGGRRRSSPPPAAPGRASIEAATDLSDEVGRHLWAIGVDTDFLFELPESQREPPADVDGQAPGRRRRVGRRRARGGPARGPVHRPPGRRGGCGRLLDVG